MGKPLDLIEEPTTGLALLAKRPAHETPEQSRVRLFWEFQFKCWRDWRAGDSRAIPRAVYACMAVGKPPPRWLSRAAIDFADRHMPDREKNLQIVMYKDHKRWEAVESARQRIDKGKPLAWAKCEQAAKDMLAKTEAAGSIRTIRKGRSLIEKAGGKAVTFSSYRRELLAQKKRRSDKRRSAKTR